MEKLAHSFFAALTVIGRSVGTGASGLFRFTPCTCAPTMVGLSFLPPSDGSFISGSFTFAQPASVNTIPIKRRRGDERQGAKARRSEGREKKLFLFFSDLGVLAPWRSSNLRMASNN